MYEIVQDFDHDIFAEKKGPFVSIYLNTHKSPSDIQQDIITFKNHLKTVESSLRKEYEDTVIEKIIKPLEKLQQDKTFWHTNSTAIAVLASTNDIVVFRLNGTVKEKAIVADSFHKKPLIRHFQTGGMFDVLALDKEHFTLYTCTQDECIRVEMRDNVPTTKEEVLGTLDQEGYLSHASYNGASNNAMYHGHDDNKDILEKDVERYFRYVDNLVAKAYSKPTKRRLILWALPEHQGVFRKLSSNPHLLEAGVHQSDKNIDEDTVLEKASEIIAPLYKKEIESIVERFKQAKANGLGSDDIDRVVTEIIRANIDTAIISADRSIPGVINLDEATITKKDKGDPTHNDVLDDIAEMVYNQGGTVIVLQEDNMPTNSGVAAIFRYKI